MALWLFRRKSRRTRSQRGTASDDDRSMQDSPTPRAPPRSRTADVGAISRTMAPTSRIPAVEPQTSGTKHRGEHAKLHRRARAYSFEAGQNDNINVDRKRSRKTKHDSAPMPARTMPIDVIDEEKYMDHLGEGTFARIPTLHNSKRDGQHLMPRKKSSKRRRRDAHDKEREAELKAMSHFVPKRTATDVWTTSRPMKDSRRVRTGLGFSISHGRSWDKENPSSDISLPMAESIDSALSSDSEHISFKISPFDVLAPKPTLRYSRNASREAPIARTPSRRQKLTEAEALPEPTLRSHPRIEELADNLSASDLRELMERDQRRRERKRQDEQERVERRLARRAEKQRAAEEEARTSGEDTPQNLERGVMGREIVGLGIDTTSATVTSSRRRVREPSPELPDDQAGAEVETVNENGRASPLESFHRTDSIVEEEPTLPIQGIGEPVLPVSQNARSRTSWGLLRARKARAMSPPLSDRENQGSEKARKGSESGSSKAPKSWTSIFKWNSRRRRHSTGPSSFSNTSRDSMATQAQLQPAPVTYVAPTQINTGVPKRTLSRFREDLPETPNSPPHGSHVLSPEAMPLATIPAEHESPEEHASASPEPAADTQLPLRETPTSEITRETPTSWLQEDDADPSPQPQAMSLASIDSEGSWLSGRINSKRRSAPAPKRHGVRSQARNSAQRSLEGSDEAAPSHEDEELAIADDEYLSRYARRSSNANSGWMNRKSTGEARPSSDEEDEARWGAVGGKVSSLVHAQGNDRVKSQEGLLNTFGEEDESDRGSLDSPVSQEASPLGDVQRARSVDLSRGHVRNFSAGSVKLLDITPQPTIETRRQSVSPRPTG